MLVCAHRPTRHDCLRFLAYRGVCLGLLLPDWHKPNRSARPSPLEFACRHRLHSHLALWHLLDSTSNRIAGCEVGLVSAMAPPAATLTFSRIRRGKVLPAPPNTHGDRLASQDWLCHDSSERPDGERNTVPDVCRDTAPLVGTTQPRGRNKLYLTYPEVVYALSAA